MKTSTKFWIAVRVSTYFWLWFIGLSLYKKQGWVGSLGELILTLVIMATGFMVTYSLFVLSEYAAQLVNKFNNWLDKQ